MSFLLVVQTLIALIIVGIALWVAFHLLKALIPHKKIVVILLLLSVVGLVIYDQGYREYKIRKDRSDNAQTYTNNYDSFYSIDDSKTYSNEDRIYDEEGDNCTNLPQFCYQMTSCSQATEAFECGNYELDGDSDGVPCESLCGSY